jgi:hypothetical protein
MIAAAQAVFDPDVEEALLRVYGIDPHRATLRRVHTLLRRLPPGEWHKDQGPAAWSREAWMLADVVDAVNQNTWVLAAVNSKRNPPKPKPYPRPGAEAQPETAGKRMSWSQIASRLAQEGDLV